MDNRDEGGCDLKVTLQDPQVGHGEWCAGEPGPAYSW